MNAVYADGLDVIGHLDKERATQGMSPLPLELKDAVKKACNAICIELFDMRTNFGDLFPLETLQNNGIRLHPNFLMRLRKMSFGETDFQALIKDIDEERVNTIRALRTFRTLISTAEPLDKAFPEWSEESQLQQTTASGFARAASQPEGDDDQHSHDSEEEDTSGASTSLKQENTVKVPWSTYEVLTQGSKSPKPVYGVRRAYGI